MILSVFDTVCGTYLVMNEYRFENGKALVWVNGGPDGEDYALDFVPADMQAACKYISEHNLNMPVGMFRDRQENMIQDPFVRS